MDQIAKYYALLVLYGQPPKDVLGGILRLDFVFNPNGFLGILTHSHNTVKVFLLYFVVLFLVLVGTFFILKSKKLDHIQQFFLTLAISGGCSNFIDRIIHDEGVVDFLQFSLGPLQSGICNPADLFIFIGSGVFGYLIFHKL